MLHKNDTLHNLIGICPAIAVTSFATTAIAMGAVLFLTMTLSALLISLTRSALTQRTRLVAQVAVIVLIVACAQIVLRAYWYDMAKTLSPYIALIAANCLTLHRCENCASREKVNVAVADAAGNGLVIVLVLLAIAIPREIIGGGSIFGIALPVSFGKNMLMAAPAGAFFIAGIIVWVIRAAGGRKTA